MATRTNTPDLFYDLNQDVRDKHTNSRPIALFDVGLNFGLTYKISNSLYLGTRYYAGVVDVIKNHYPNFRSDIKRQMNRFWEISTVYLLKK